MAINLVISQSVGKDNVETVSFSPDGKQLAIGAGDGVIALYPLGGGPGAEPLVQKLHNGFVSGLAWSPAGDRLLSAAADGSVRLSNASLQVLRSLTAFPGQHPAVAWAPDGKSFALAKGRDSIELYDAAGVSLIGTFNVPGVTRAALFLPNGELAASNEKGSVLFFSRGQAQPVRTFTPGTSHGLVNSLSLAGASLAIGYDDGTVDLIDPATGKVLAEPVKGRQIGNATWSPNGKLLAVSSVAFTLDFWDTQGTRMGHIDVGYDVNGVAWSPDGKFVASGVDDHTLKIWQMTPAQGVAAATPPAYMGR